MNMIFYLSSILIISTFTVFASSSDWRTKYPDFKSRLRGALTERQEHPIEELILSSTVLAHRAENIADVNEILDSMNLTPFDLYNTLAKPFMSPELTELSGAYYKEQRSLAKAPKEFNEFDAQFCSKLFTVQVFKRKAVWSQLGGLSTEEEVMCEAAYFYGLIDFKRAITCLDAAPSTTLTCRIFSNFVADMYFGEASRPDLSYDEDRKWLDDMIKKYRGGQHSHATSLMSRFVRNIRGEVDDKLWSDYMHAMMTIHLSAALLKINKEGMKGILEYIVNNRIRDEFVFASRVRGPLQPSQTEGEGHAFLRTFKFDPDTGAARTGIINSGFGLSFHINKLFKLDELPDTISQDRHDVSVSRFIPFVIYDAVPRDDWNPIYTVTNSQEEMYFEDKYKRVEFDNYQPWQYIDNQRAGTCTAMSLWTGLYWLEQKSQQNLESFRLTLHLEMLKEAGNELSKLRKELEELESQKLEALSSQIPDDDDDDDEVDATSLLAKSLIWETLQTKIDEMNNIEHDYLRFFTVGFNSAIRSIRYLHSDPFEQGLDMTLIMQKYADFYESQGDEKYWILVRENIDDLFHSTYIRIKRPMIWVTPRNVPKISTSERECVSHVRRATKAKDPFNFVKAVISGTESKCLSKTFLSSIYFAVDELDLQTHHGDLILRALTKEAHLLRGGKLTVLKFVEKLITDYGFRLFPVYDVSPTGSIDYAENVHQIFELEDDTEMQQFAVNCTRFKSPARYLLETVHGMVKTAWKTLTENPMTGMILESTEEYKLYIRILQLVSSQLQLMNPHLYAQHLGSLIWNAEQTGIIEYIDFFRPSKEWNQDDYTLLGNAAQKDETHEDLVKEYIERSRS